MSSRQVQHSEKSFPRDVNIRVIRSRVVLTAVTMGREIQSYRESLVQSLQQLQHLVFVQRKMIIQTCLHRRETRTVVNKEGWSSQDLGVSMFSV